MHINIHINNKVSDAISSVAVKYGATIKTNAEVTEIICENGRAAGARTADGTTYVAPVCMYVCMYVCMCTFHLTHPILLKFSSVLCI